MECPVCSAKISDESYFCDNCGANLTRIDPPTNYYACEVEVEEPNPVKISYRSTMGIVGALLVIASTLIVTGLWLWEWYVLMSGASERLIEPLCVLGGTALLVVLLGMIQLIKRKPSTLLSSLCLIGVFVLLCYASFMPVLRYYSVYLIFYQTSYFYVVSIIGVILMLVSPSKPQYR